MTVLRTGLAAAVALSAVLIASTPARAAEPPPPAPPPPAADNAGDKAMAEALFRAAKELQAEGKLAAACPKYMESHRLDPKPGSILNVATCHELEGRTATAWADYAEAATFAARAHQADREKFARGKVDELAKKLSYVTFRFPDVASLEVVLDGKPLTTAAAGTRVPIDPGEHVLEARAPRKVAWTTRVTFAAGPAELTVEVPSLADDGAAAVAAPPASAPASNATGADVSGGHATQRVIGWLALGVGVGALGAGGFFGLRTLSEKSTVDQHCMGPRCDETGLQANDSAKSAATISTIAFVAGGALVVTGVLLLVTPR